MTVATPAAVITYPATCPLCHTADAITATSLEAGESWLCTTCGQRWDSARLETVAAYARYVASRSPGTT